MKKKLKFTALCCLASFAGMVSCVSVTDRLDLEKDISLDIQLAPGGTSIPLGSLDRIYIDSLVSTDESSPVSVLDDGAFGISINGSVDSVGTRIDALTISVPSPSLQPLTAVFENPAGNLDIIISTDLIPEYSVTPITSKLLIESDVDPALVSIRRLVLEQPASVDLLMDFTGLPASCQAIDLKDVTIALPSFLTPLYSGSDPRISTSGSIVTVNGSLLRSAGEMDSFTIPLSIEGLDFGKPVETEASVFSIEGDIEMSGTFKLGGETVNINDLGSVTVDPSIVISDLTVSEVTGVFSPDIDPISKSVDLNAGSDLEFLAGGNNRLVVSDPQFALSLTSSITLPVDLDISLSSKDSDGGYIARDIVPTNGKVSLPACPQDQPSRTTVFILTCRPKPDTADTVYVHVPGLAELTRTIPASVGFDLSVSTDGTEQTLALDRPLSVDVKYEVSAPFAFDDLHIEYTDTISGLAESLEDIADKAGAVTLKLKATAESTLPFGLSLTASPYDAAMQPLKGITISTCALAAGGEKPVESDIILEMKAAAGTLGTLDNLVLKAECDAHDATLMKGQYVQIKDMSLSLPEGVTLDFTDEK